MAFISKNILNQPLILDGNYTFVLISNTNIKAIKHKDEYTAKEYFMLHKIGRQNYLSKKVITKLKEH